MSLRSRWRAWFYRRTAPEPAPIILDRRRIYILPTRTGFLYGLVLVAMYVGSVNYNLGLGHALVFLLVGLGCVGMLHTYRNLVDLEITPRRCAPVFAGDAIVHRVSLSNHQPRDRVSLTLSRGAQMSNVPVIPAGGDAELALVLPAAARGVHPIGRIRISTCYPLGLYEAWSYPYPDVDALVYPRPLIRPLPAPIGGSESGDRRGESGDEDFSGLRPRQPADSLRHVAWKAFARDPENRALHVKTFAGGATPEIWLDWTLTPGDLDDETRLSVLCGWVLQASRLDARYGLRLPGREFAIDDGEAHRERCLALLATIEFGKPPR